MSVRSVLLRQAFKLTDFGVRDQAAKVAIAHCTIPQLFFGTFSSDPIAVIGIQSSVSALRLAFSGISLFQSPARQSRLSYDLSGQKKG